jgi:hypothetical protein
MLKVKVGNIFRVEDKLARANPCTTGRCACAYLIETTIPSSGEDWDCPRGPEVGD